MAFKPIDGKRDEYRKFLERTGVFESLTKALGSLYYEKCRPENAVDYILCYLGDVRKDKDQIASLTSELAAARLEIEELKKCTVNKCETCVGNDNEPHGDQPPNTVIQTAEIEVEKETNTLIENKEEPVEAPAENIPLSSTEQNDDKKDTTEQTKISESDPVITTNILEVENNAVDVNNTAKEEESVKDPPATE